MIKDDGVVHEARYPHPVSAVWDALTDPAALAAWLMPNSFVAQVGHRFQLDARPAVGFVEGEVLDLEPPALLRCRWTIDGVPSIVTIRLEPDGKGTLLHLEHARLTPETRSGFDGGWSEKLETALVLVLTGVKDPTRSLVEEGLY